MERKPFPDMLHTTPEEKAAAAAVEREAAEVEAELDKRALHGQLLDRWVGFSAGMTEAVVKRALGDAVPPPPPELEGICRADPEAAALWLTDANLPMAFERTTRTGRTLIEASAAAFDRRRELARTIRRAGEPPSQTMLERQKRVGKVVRAELAAQIMDAADPAEHETLFREADRWLENPSVISALGEVPFGRIVISLTECMGLRPKIRRYTDKELGINIPWVKPERPLGCAPMPQDQLPRSKVWWTPPPGQARADKSLDDDPLDEDPLDDDPLDDDPLDG
jgi:hypothetical protein